ncbi:MAG: hypothetical protein C0599_04205 [Salinivirgaceae bacterium]|nr:MAG: hypothetical protein C0599_04205 [Salinivirgaceae bacterium]
MLFKKLLTAFLVLISFSFASAQSFVQIGDGTESSSVPYTAWNYSWSKVLYSSSDLGDAKSISGVALQVYNFSGTLSNQKIYIKQTSNTSLDGSYEDTASSSLTLVFDGDYVSSGQTTGEWLNIDFIAPFEYDGTDNVELYFVNEHGTSVYNNFYASAVTGDLVKVSGNDDSFPTSSGYNPYPNALPNIRFYYASAGPATPTNPLPGENMKYVDAETQLSFDLDATATSFDVYFSDVQSDVTGMVASALIADDEAASAAGTYTISLTDSLLESKTIYYWQVVASDGTNTSASPVWAFETQKVISDFPYNQDFEGGNDVVFHIYGPEYSDWYWANDLDWSDRGTYTQNGDSCAYISPGFLDEGVEYELRTPRFNLPTNKQISFWWFNGDSIPGGKIANVDSTYFQISTDGASTWETLATLSPTEAQQEYQQVLTDLSAYSGNNVYLRWVYKVIDAASYPKNTYLDNIEIKEISNEPEISLNVSSLNFDEIALGGYNAKQVVITNNNLSFDLVITGVTTGDGFTCDFSGTIGGGEKDTAIIVFEPNTAGVTNSTATFEIDGSFLGSNVITISGTGVDLQSSIYEYFDDTPTGQIPEGWHRISNPENDYHFVQVKTGVTGEYNSPPNVLRLYNSDEFAYPLMAILPGVSGFDTNILEFYAVKSAMDPVALYVGVMDNPFDASSFEVVDTIWPEQTIAQYSVSFPTSNAKPYIAFSHAMNDSIISSIRIDDVVWKDPNSLGVPNAAGDVYPVHQSSEIDIMSDLLFAWSNEGGEPTGYKISLGTTSAANELLENIEMGDVTSYTYDLALEYNTTYYWKVVAYNDNGDAENSEIWEFTTMQNPLINSFPWLADFNNYDVHLTSSGNFRYPLGWSIENNNSQYYCWDKLSNNPNSPNNAYSDSVAMHIINFSFNDPLDDWLFTNPLYLEQGSQYELSFWYKTSEFPGDATVEKMEVKWGTDNTSASMFTEPLFYNDNITVRDYTNFSTIISPETTGEYYIGFHAFSDPMQWIIHLDDVQMSMVQGGTVTFIVNGDGGPLEGAEISIDGAVLTTDAAGEAQVSMENGTYNYTVTANGFGTVNGEVIVNNEDVNEVVAMTDIHDISAAGFNLYPNPVKDQFIISGNGEYTVNIVNSLGQMVVSKIANDKTKLDMSHYTSGVYMVMIKYEGKVYSTRIVVE